MFSQLLEPVFEGMKLVKLEDSKLNYYIFQDTLDGAPAGDSFQINEDLSSCNSSTVAIELSSSQLEDVSMSPRTTLKAMLNAKVDGR